MKHRLRYPKILFRAAIRCAALLAIPSDARANPQPAPGFDAEVLIENLHAATTFEFSPNGRLHIAEQTGRILRWDAWTSEPTVVLDISDRVDDYWERGLIGMEFHPEFPKSPYIYVVYVAKDPYPHHVVSRFQSNGATFSADSETVLSEGDDQRQFEGSVVAGHQGGPIVFGPDGFLYFAIGESTTGDPSQALDSLLGKILRIHPDGAIPSSNPFLEETNGKYQAIWARGLRNPYGLAFQPDTHRLIASDVGSSGFEEINHIVAGKNYGWPHAEGPSENSDFENPIHAYPPTTGKCISGGAFYPKTDAPNAFPEVWQDTFLFVDWGTNWARAINLNQPNEPRELASGLDKPVWIEIGPDNAVYILNRGTIWRDGNRFESNSGSLVRIAPSQQADAMLAAAPIASQFPSALNAQQFPPPESPNAKSPWRRFEINHPPFRPGFRTEYYYRPPEDAAAIQLDTVGALRLPKGALVAEHVLTIGGTPWETRLFWVNDWPQCKAAAYVWNDTKTSTIAKRSSVRRSPGPSDSLWLTPAPTLSQNIFISLTGESFPVNARQWNREIIDPNANEPVNQLVHWKTLGLIDTSLSESQITQLPRLVSLQNKERPIIDRIRSYLDVNCAACHQPGGPSRGLFDARWTTPLEKQGLIGAPAITNDLDIDDLRLVAPGEPQRSSLYLRLERADFLKMPPAVLHTQPAPILEDLALWIESLGDNEPEIQFEPNAVDPSADNLSAYRIETPTSTYYLEKQGAGLSSLIDSEGVDWLSFHPKAGSGPNGEYRGFPNAIHNQPNSDFHPLNQATTPATTQVLYAANDRVSIAAESQDGLWKCRYDFYNTHLTFTMLNAPRDGRYWILYEGTPGGAYEDEDWYIVSGDPSKRTAATLWNDDLPSPEWIAFGDKRSPRVLALVNHQDDPFPDKYYPMQNAMTVFGFGRDGLKKFHSETPHQFSTGFIESNNPKDISKTILNRHFQNQ